MSKPLHVLALSVSAGAGHVRAAQALAAAGENDEGLRVTHLDVMTLVPDSFRELYCDAYIKLVERAPLLWAYLYQRSNQRESRSLFDRLRRQVERLNLRKLSAEIERLAPDVIVCTHFLPAELLSRRIQRGHSLPPVWVHVTDFDVHGMWLQSNVRGYCVASDEVAARLSAHGVDAAQVHVTGIAIMPQFSAAPARAEAAAELGLDANTPTVLMMSGGAGVGGIEQLVESAASLPQPLQVIALAGRNEALLKRLQALAAQYPGRVFPMGFTRTIERVMAASDIAITKPGGLTTAECLAMNLPMIVVSPIPGQEERNADFLLESGCALKAVDAAALRFKLQALIAEPQRLAQMRKQQALVARPQAAQQILRLVTER